MADKSNISHSLWENGRFVGVGIACSSLTSLMLILAFHPFNRWYFAFFALVPMLVAQHLILPLRWSGVAVAVGIGGWLYFFLTAMFQGNPAGRVIQFVVLVIVILQLVITPGVRRFHLRTGYRWFVLEGIFGWVGFEMVRSFIPPINTHAFIAQTMYTQPWMLQPISVFSIYGLGLLLVLINFALARGLFYFIEPVFMRERRYFELRPALKWMATAIVAFSSWTGISLVILSDTPSDYLSIRVAAIQHNFPIPAHQDTKDSQAERLKALAEKAREAGRQGARLIVMPELGLGFDPQVKYSVELKNLAAETGAYLLIGYGLDDPGGWRNEAVMLTPEGTFLATYGKHHPTSPGEPTIVTAGEYPVYSTSFGELATIICNDVHWTDSSRRLALEGAQLICVPTLEAPGIVEEQVAQTVLRAVENRVAMVKADAAYASAVIGPHGNIIALRDGSPEGESFALIANVQLGSGPTVYSRLGDWVGWISLAGLVFFAVFQAVSLRKSGR